MTLLVRGAVFILIAAVVMALLHVWINQKSYVFDEKKIFDVTKKAITKLNKTGIYYYYCPHLPVWHSA